MLTTEPPLSSESRITISVPDPGCLSRILIYIHPGSQIPDLTIATKEVGGKYLLPYLFMLVTSLTKLKTCFVCEKVSYRKKS